MEDYKQLLDMGGFFAIIRSHLKGALMETLIVTRWRLRLKGPQLMKMGRGASNPHELSLRSGLSYPTVVKYTSPEDAVKAYDGSVLPSILIEGQGMDPDEFMNLRLGDLFTLERSNGAK